VIDGLQRTEKNCRTKDAAGADGGARGNMRLRHWVAGPLTAGGVLAMAIVLFEALTKAAVPESLAAVGVWSPAPIDLMQAETGSSGLIVAKADLLLTTPPPARPVLVDPDISPAEIEPPFITWSREVGSGDTLDSILAEAKLTAPDRAKVALALSVEYDLRQLRPGHLVEVVSTTEGNPRYIKLAVDDGVRIEATFDNQVTARTVMPDPELVIFAGEARIESSVFAALAEAGIPARFAVDLAQMLGGTIDFRRDLAGGESLRLMWREAHVGGESITQPEITFAALDVGDALYEIVWPDDGTGRATIYLDGEVLRVFAQPVEGARLSSVFGRRVHPIYGDVRMHTGVDFAAAQGTPVHATAPGRVSFIGRRSGYGRVVEISHGSDTLTRYAHLSAVPDGLVVGQSVAAGDVVGNVGASGTATAPNLHYEVLVDGRPTDPLSGDRLADASEQIVEDGAALVRLAEVRDLLEGTLSSKISANASGDL